MIAAETLSSTRTPRMFLAIDHGDDAVIAGCGSRRALEQGCHILGREEGGSLR